MIGHRRAATRIFLFVLKFPPACVRPADGRSGRDRPPAMWPPSPRVPCTRPTVVVFKLRFGYDSDSYNPCTRFPRGVPRALHARRPNEYRRIHVRRTISRSLSWHRLRFVWLQFIARPKSKNIQIRLRIFRTPPSHHYQSTVIRLSLHCKHVIIINRTSLCWNRYHL